MVTDEQALSELDAEQLREVSQRLLAELRHQRALNEKLAYECALLKRLKFAAKSERHSLDQRNLLEEELDGEARRENLSEQRAINLRDQNYIN